MSDPDQIRASGSTQNDEVTEAEAGSLEETVEQSLDLTTLNVEPTRATFTRIRTDWTGEEGDVVASLHGQIDTIMHSTFPDVYQLLEELYDIVRTPEVDAEGHPILDLHGKKVWSRNFYGDWHEDWSKLTRMEQEHFMFRITTRLTIWRQRSDKLWMEALLAKARWEERFSVAYGAASFAGRRDTIESRTSHAKADAAEERYFAVYTAAVSRRSASLVGSMELIAQRIKDVMTA
jgi:hypothetical protein